MSKIFLSYCIKLLSFSLYFFQQTGEAKENYLSHYDVLFAVGLTFHPTAHTKQRPTSAPPQQLTASQKSIITFLILMITLLKVKNG